MLAARGEWNVRRRQRPPGSAAPRRRGGGCPPAARSRRSLGELARSGREAPAVPGRPGNVGGRSRHGRAGRAEPPVRFHRHRGVHGAHEPDRRSLRLRRARLRRGEERAPGRLRQPDRSDADGRGGSARSGRRLLGSRPARARARPELPGQSLRVPPLCGRRPAGRHDPDVERRLPVAARADHRRLCREREARPHPAVRRHEHRFAAGAPERPVVPAVPEPLGGRSRLRP